MYAYRGKFIFVSGFFLFTFPVEKDEKMVFNITKKINKN